MARDTWRFSPGLHLFYSPRHLVYFLLQARDGFTLLFGAGIRTLQRKTSCLSRCVFQHLSAEAERCLITVSTAEEMLLLSSYHCSSPPTLGVKVVVGGSQPHLCLVEELLVDGTEVFQLLPKLHQGILLLTDVLLQHLHRHLHLLLHPNLHLQFLLHILQRLIIETGTNYFGVF